MMFFFVIENLGKDSRFLVSRAENVVGKSSLLVEFW